MPRPAPTAARPRQLRGPLTRGIAVVVALLAGFVALAPSAVAWHSRSYASVECIGESTVLDYTVLTWDPTAYPDQVFDETDFENPDIRVFVQYGTADAEVGGLTDVQVGAGAFTDGTASSIAGSVTLTPPAGTTRVRVHSDAFAPWGSGATTIPHWEQTTEWMALPTGCTPEEPPVEVVVDASITYDCEVSALATVTVTSTGGTSTFVVRVDGVVVATLTDVEGTDSVDIPIDSDEVVDVVVEVDEEEILADVLDPTLCPEVGGIVTQPTPPTTPTTTPTTAPTTGATTLPRTGAGATTLLVVVALSLAGLGVALVAAERRAAYVDVDRG